LKNRSLKLNIQMVLEKIIKYLENIPKDLIMIIYEYCDNYKSYEFVDKYDSNIDLCDIYSSDIHNGKIYMTKYIYEPKSNLLIYDIKKKEIEVQDIPYTKIFGVKIYKNKLYIVSDFELISYTLDPFCWEDTVSIVNNLNFLIHSKTPFDYALYNLYAELHYSKNVSAIFYWKHHLPHDCYYFHNDFLYKTKISKKSTKIEIIGIINQKKTEIILPITFHDFTKQKKLIVDDFNIYLQVGGKFYCFDFCGKLNYKIKISKYVDKFCDTKPSYKNTDIIIDREYIYVVIRNKIITLKQK